MKLSRLAVATWAIVVWVTVAGAYPEEDAAEPKRVLDLAERAISRSMGGGQASFQFWEGFEAGTEVEFRSDATVRGKRYGWEASYRIVKREKGALTLEVVSGGQRHEMRIARPQAAPDNFKSRLREAPMDREIGGTERVKVGDRGFACRVFERIVKSYPLCGTGAPRYGLTRARVWRCSGIPVQGGIAKIAVSSEEDWGDGLKVRSTSELNVTELEASRKIGWKHVACYVVSLRDSSEGEVRGESTQWRCDAVPGGVVGQRSKLRMEKGAEEWRTDRYWIERLETVPRRSGQRYRARRSFQRRPPDSRSAWPWYRTVVLPATPLIGGELTDPLEARRRGPRTARPQTR